VLCIKRRLDDGVILTVMQVSAGSKLNIAFLNFDIEIANKGRVCPGLIGRMSDLPNCTSNKGLNNGIFLGLSDVRPLL